MADPTSAREAASTWQRLSRRKVVQWGLAYAAGAWVLLQVLALVVESYEWPHAVMRVAFGLAVLGQLVAIVIAWYHGDRGEQRVTRPELAILTLLFLLSGALLWRYEHASRTTTVATVPTAAGTRSTIPADDHSIAVLPFVNMSADKDQEYFADGMAEEVLNLLTQLPQLRVIARTSSFSFKGKEVDVATIARTLDVAHVLEGSVRKSGDTVRITAQLIRASDSSHLWSQTYDRKLTDVFRIQDEIAGAVVAALKVKLVPQQRVTNAYRTASTDAYNQYLLGNQFFNRSTPDGFRRALTAYRQSVELDPAYAPAYARLAMAEFFASDYVGTRAEIAAGKERALAAANKSVALAPDLADGYANRGWVRGAGAWDWEGARLDLEKAVTLESGNSWIQLLYGNLLYYQGDLPGSRAAYTKAAELDPLSAWAWSALGESFAGAGQWAEAREAMNRQLAVSPESMFLYWSLGRLELLHGRPQQALEAFRRADSFWSQAGVAMAEHSLGHEKESRQALDDLIATQELQAAYQIAGVYAWRGEKDQAFLWLERAYDQRDGGLCTVKSDPLLASLRSDPRFAAMLQKIGLPQ